MFWNNVKMALRNLQKATARTMRQQFLVRVGAESFYQQLRFTDPELFQIFDMQYIHGDETALENPSGLVLSESAAIRYFGTTDVMVAGSSQPPS